MGVRGLDVPSSVRSIFASRRMAMGTAFLFTGVINALMMAMPIYSLQMFSSVVPTSSFETLVTLTAMAASALVVMTLLELVRESDVAVYHAKERGRSRVVRMTEMSGGG